MAKKAQPRDIDPKRLASGIFATETLKNNSASAKRAATTIRKVIKDLGTEIDADEKLCLEQALAVVDRAAIGFDRAHRLRQASDALRDKRYAEARAIAKRAFGSLSTVEEKLAFIAVQEPWELDSLARAARSGMRHPEIWLDGSFRSALESAAVSIAGHDGDMEQRAADGVAKWADLRGRALVKHATAIASIKQAMGG